MKRSPLVMLITAFEKGLEFEYNKRVIKMVSGGVLMGKSTESDDPFKPITTPLWFLTIMANDIGDENIWMKIRDYELNGGI